MIQFSNEKILRDFDALMTSFFTGGHTQQPTALIEIDCQDANALLHAYTSIHSTLLRNDKQKNTPFEVIALVLDPNKFSQIREKLASIPHRVALISDTKPETILQVLKNIGAGDERSRLYLSNQTKNVSLEDLNTNFGWIEFKSYSDLSAPESSLLNEAMRGWFPRVNSCFIYPAEKSTLIYFEKKPYIVRQATIQDLPSLVTLEEVCWPKDLGMPLDVLKKRIETYPNGQLVLEIPSEGVVGVVYSQRIDSIERLDHMQADTVSQLHTPKGPFVQLLALNILPNKQRGDLGSHLLEFMLQKATFIADVTHVTGVTRCIEYPGSHKISMESYLKQELLDPVPKMHYLHGAEIRGVVPNYRPKDVANEGYGVLVVYSLKTRQPKTESIQTILTDDLEITPETIGKSVDAAIIELLSPEEQQHYSRKIPLMDLGLDSLQLMELRFDLGSQFSIELSPTFFFEYGTAEKTINYLIEKKFDQYKDWLYDIQWVVSPPPNLAGYTPDRLWIIFDEGSELLSPLVSTLEKNYQYCVIVKPGKTFQKLNEQTFTVNPESAHDFTLLFETIPHLNQLAGVLYMWGRTGFESEPSLTEIKSYLKANCSGFINLANVLAASHRPESAKLMLINKSMITDGTEDSLVQTSLSALSKVVREEYPKSNCTFLALDPQASGEENVELLCQELQNESHEPQIAWRNKKRFVARMVPAQINKIRTPRFSSEASYLIAGGLRPLGLCLARWYIAKGAKTLILLDELELNTKIESEIEKLKALGATIIPYVVEFDDYSRLELIFDTIKKELPPLKGVVHSAGMINDDLLIHMNWDHFTSIFRLKVAGAWNLHLLTKSLQLDHFILFSTIMADLAPLGKASNIVCNTFLDTLAQLRRHKNLPALAINWAPWDLHYVVMEHMVDISLASRVKPMDIEDSLKVFENIFYVDQPQIMAVQVDWSMLLKKIIRENPLFEEMVKKFELKPNIASKELSLHEPIAIIGIGCRFPGSADTPDKFWRIFKEGIDTIREVPSNRWDIDAYYDPDKNAPGKMYTRFGGFIDNVDLFDPQFFGISPREAKDMDPQQRISLEVTWEALENACIPPQDLKGSNTGVFIGICFDDYSHLITQSGDISAVDDYYSTGNHFSVSAGRISYILGLEGPCMVIDTACSSSLVCIDTACEKLHIGECDMAIAGGVNLILAPESTINFCKSGMLAVDGRCKTFDAAANGYVRSEGCGIVILKRLSDAVRDGNRILALIRSTAINQDGASTGLTVPNGLAQEKVIKAALAKANLEGKDIHYVEAHGTGTSLGDPIEVKAIVATYGQNRIEPLILGSAKTNIGHAEAAAGVAGLIKCVLALQNKTIPKHLHFHKINPYIQLENAKIAKDETVWDKDKPRFAAVSSFGFSGTNAHAILEEAPQIEIKQNPIERPFHIVTLSGKNKQAIEELLKSYQSMLETHPELSIADIANTANVGRSHFTERAAILAGSTEELLTKIKQRNFLEKGAINLEWKPKIAFLFTGGGSQYFQMGQQLYETHPTFRSTVDRCAEILKSDLEHPLLSVLWGEHKDLLDRMDYMQPALFVLEYALAELWKEWGVLPDAMIGHSLGEYAAATVAGVFSLEDALKLVTGRGKLMHMAPGNGAMASIAASEEQVLTVIRSGFKNVSIGAVNAPESTMISGDKEEVQKILKHFEREGVRVKLLPISNASHSPLMDPMLDEFRKIAEGISYHPPKLALISNLTGKMVDKDTINADYWVKHVRQPVRFYTGMQALEKLGCTIFLEIGPDPVLIGIGVLCLPNQLGPWLPSLQKDKDNCEILLGSLAKLYCQGVPINWKAFEAPYHRQKIALPTYPFQRQRYWIKDIHPSNRLLGKSKVASATHPFLFHGIQSPLFSETIFESEISEDWPDFIQYHQIYGIPVVAGAVYLSSILSAAKSLTNKDDYLIENVGFEAPLILAKGESRLVQTIIKSEEEGKQHFEIYSCQKSDAKMPTWTRHFQGWLSKEKAISHSSEPLESVKARCSPEYAIDTLYQRFNDAFEYAVSSHFQGIEHLFMGKNELVAKLHSPHENVEESKYVLYPGLIDSFFQTPLIKILDEASEKTLATPFSIREFFYDSTLGKPVWVHGVYKESSENLICLDFTLYSETGNPVGHILDYVARAAPKQALLKSLKPQTAKIDDWLYEWIWEELPLENASTPTPLGHWLLLSDGEASNALATLIESHGGTCRRIPASEHPKTKKAFVDLLQEEPFAGIIHAASTEIPAPLTHDSIQKAQEFGSESFLHLSQALVQLEGILKIPLFLITRKITTGNPAQSPLLALFKTIFVEHPELKARIIDLDATLNPTLLWNALFSKKDEPLMVLKEARCEVPRLLRSRDAKVRRHELVRPLDDNFRLKSKQKGLLENLTLAELEIKEALSPDEVEVEVHAVGLNFRDVLDSLGLYPGDAGPLGFDGSGIVTRVGSEVKNLKPGDSVLGMMSGSLARKTYANRETLTLKPSTLSFEEAATLPTVFLTVHYAFSRCTELKKTDTVLIHAGAGGVGQAAIQLAKQVGATIIVTAGSAKKRDFLKAQGIEHVFDSRSLSYGKEIEKLTQGKGVDVVLNSLSGEGFIETTLGICKKGARFIEIGKRNILTKEEMFKKRPDIEYHILALDDIYEKNPEVIQALLKELMPLFQSGHLKPLPIKTFPIEESIDAFKYLQGGNNIGKVVITLPPQEKVEDKISPNATYLITGGLGGLGRTLAKWLIEKGAKHLVLTGRSKPDQEALKALQDLGAIITYESLDISDEHAVEELLTRLTTAEKPLKGIFHLAGILDDAPLMEQNWERFEKIFAPKVYGSYYLHRHSKNLDFFVMFSSLMSNLGNPGQSNYAAANSFMNALCDYRKKQGLPAHSLSWGPWAEIGMAKESSSRLTKRGMIPFEPQEGMQALEKVLLSNQTNIIIANINWKTYLEKNFNPSTWLQAYIEQKVNQVDLFTKLQAAASTTESLEILETFVTDVTRVVLGFSASQNIDPTKSFFTMGLDSIMSMELQNRLHKGINKKATLASTAVFDHPTVEKMTQFLAKLLKIQPVETAAAKQSSHAEITPQKEMNSHIDELSVDDLLNQLENELKNE